MPCERHLLFGKVAEIFIFIGFMHRKDKSGRRKASFLQEKLLKSYRLSPLSVVYLVAEGGDEID